MLILRLKGLGARFALAMTGFNFRKLPVYGWALAGPPESLSDKL